MFDFNTIFGSTCAAMLLIVVLAPDAPNKQEDRTLKTAIEKCNVETSKKNKEIQLDIMYHCNNNVCVNYGMSYYMLQCLYNLK